MSDERLRVYAKEVMLFLDGKACHHWRSLEVGRDLANIAGTFRAELGVPFPLPEGAMPRHGARVTIVLHNQPVLKGFVEVINTRGDQRSLSVTISGRDITGDLIDCAANPTGPAEYRHIRLESLIGHLTQPFGVSLDRQVDTGAPFTLVALDPSDHVLSAIEQHSRQRGVLVTSDGVRGLVLTTAGDSHAADTLTYPGGNVTQMEVRLNQRHSDHYVKGQSRSFFRGRTPPLHASAAAGAGPSASGASTHEERATCQLGHCADPHVTRYRPAVYLARTQSGSSEAAQQTTATTAPAQRSAGQPWTLNDQAAWRMRTARAHASAYLYTVPGFLNAAGELWRPNQLVTVTDTVNAIHGDMLIGAVTWVAGAQRFETRISVVSPDAYDLSHEATGVPRHGRLKRQHGHAWRKR